MKKQYSISGSGLNLRNICLEDVNQIYAAWLNDPGVNRYLETRFVTQTIERIEQYITAVEADPDSVLMAICLKDNSRHIGNIKLGPINRNHGFADVSLFIGEKDCWGRGYATEAIELACSVAFGQMDLNKLNAGCYETNIGSKRAFEKAGFDCEGVYKKMFKSKGKYVDCFLFSLLKRTWTDKDRSV